MPPTITTPATTWQPPRLQPHPNKARVGSRTATALAQATEALKQRYKEERQLLAMRQRQQALQQRPTTKKDTHRPAKLTANTRSSFNAVALSACPGATRGGVTASIMLMVAAKTTGTRLATKGEERRLANSALNANTTSGNYNSSYRR